jgi:peptidoglycan/LPS O-acetylase OafA/YrhL
MGLLRVILAIAVVLSHAGQIPGYAAMPAPTAVQAFYIISGFYMSLVLDGKYASGLRGTLTFYVSRFLRLAPTYWLVASATLVVFLVTRFTFVGPLPPIWHDYAITPLFAQVALAASNVLIFGQDLLALCRLDLGSPTGLVLELGAPPTSIPSSRFFLVPQAWSLGVELSFYLLAPLLLRRSGRTVALLCLASVLLRIAGYHWGLDHDPWTYRFFPFELALFLAGNLAYRLGKAGGGGAGGRRALGVASMGLALGFAVFGFGAGLPSPVAPVVFLSALPLCLPWLFGLTARWKWDRWLGELSYPIYLSHFLVVRWAAPYQGLVLSGILVAVASLLCLFAETRVEPFRQRLVVALGREGFTRETLRSLCRPGGARARGPAAPG